MNVQSIQGIRCLHMWKLWPVVTYRLDLNFGFVLDLDKIFYITSFSRNLISVSRLLPLSFSFNFIGTSFHLFKNLIVVGGEILDDGLFILYGTGD